MIQPAQYRRLALMALLLLVAFAGLGYRLVDLQVLRHEVLSHQATVIRERTIIHASRRGDILDARGNVLATTVFVKTVFADPSLIGTNQALVARTLAPLLKLNEAELAQKLRRAVWTDKDGTEREDKHVVLKKKVSREDWARIQAAMKNLSFDANERKLPARERAQYRNLRLRAISVEPVDDQLRVYPNGSLAAHVLGFVGVTNRIVEHKEVNGLVGRYGIEGQFDSYLNGALGWRQTERDGADRELAVFREEDIEARPGLNVVLTIDAGVQDIVESELARGMQMSGPQSISCVVVRPGSGAVAAMASLPAFDPNRPGESTPMAYLRNRVIADVYEPGSTFKTIVVSAALNERLVTLDDIFYCEEGRFSFAGYTLHDAGHHYGNLSVEDIIVKSSNIGAAKVGMKLGPALVYQYIRSFGFGDPTGLALPGEARGLVHPVKDWYKVSIAQIPMGQGLAVTPLQMTMAVSAIANRGRLVRPAIVDRLEDQQNNLVVRYPAQPVRQVIGEDNARLMVQALKKVVLAGGTAPKANLEHYTVAGKTGTGQKPPYGSHKYFSSFIGFFPADDPELCIGVFLDEPDPKVYYGGETAGPIFKAIAERAAAYLGIHPDLAPEPPPEPITGQAQRVAQQTAASTPLTPVESGRNF